MTDAFVSCVVGHVEYALRAGDIVAVMRSERMRPPGAGEAGIGVVTIGGERTSVYPLGQTVGPFTAADDGANGRDRHVVVVRGAQGPVGWLVDRAGRSHLPPHARVLPLPTLLGTRATRAFAGVLSAGDRTLLLLAATPPARRATVPARAATPRRTAPVAAALATSPLVVTFTSTALPDCGASRYAVSARQVCGVESNLDVAAVPGSEPPVIGVGVWHGGVLPVIDLRHETAPRERTRRRLLILRGGSLADTPVALPVDAETALWQPTDDNAAIDAARDGGALPPFVAGLFDVRGHTIALIDPDRFLDERCAATEPDAPADGAGTPAGRLSTAWTLDHRRPRA